MSETNASARKKRLCLSAILPVFLCAVTAVVFELIADCRLIRIEDAYTWNILSGAYGTPDWRVLEMNPLLSQLLALLFRVAPSVPWYGLTLIILLCGGCAALIGLCARRRGGLLPAVILVLPICALLNQSMISTAVCAVCVAAGFLLMQEGLREKGENTGSLVIGLILFLFGAALNLVYGAILSACIAICLLPRCIRDGRVKALAKGVPITAVLLAALFGYQSLMFFSPELSAWRANYTLYDRLQHSDLPAERDRLLLAYGEADFGMDSDHAGHDHETEEHADSTPEERSGIFYQAGLSLNDADLFFGRMTSDAELTSPETLHALDDIASYIDTDAHHLLSALAATLKKPQFLMLIALFMLSALLTLLTSRGRGLTALLAAVVAFGAHIFLLMCNYDAFSYIAPFYVAGIAVMLFTLDGEAVLEKWRRLLPARSARAIISVALCFCVAICCGGLAVYSMYNPTNGNGTAAYEVSYLTKAIAEGAKSENRTLFIGDSPVDRFKYRVLEETPERGSLSTLLAGGYDLYSPRYAAMLEEFGTENPLRDCIGRDDIEYVNMGFLQGKLDRVKDAYGGDYFIADAVVEDNYGSSKIYRLRVVDSDTFSQYVIDQSALEEEEFQALLDAGDPKAVYTQAINTLSEIEAQLEEASTKLQLAQASNDEAAITAADAEYDALTEQYADAQAAYQEAAEALLSRYDEIASDAGNADEN